jgi:NAD(P)-dependent dehydrogenase (short-subunit alcohol dehydrogenase family)
MGTKAGIDHIVLCIANEFGNKSIRANSISPGLESAFVKEYVLGRLGISEDIARTTLFLADENCFITSQNIQVSGGLTLRRNPLVSEITSSIDSN